MTHNWNNSWFSVFRVSIWAEMHNAGEVVSLVEMRYFRVSVLFEVIFFARPNIFPLNCNIIVTVIGAVHVVESKC